MTRSVFDRCNIVSDGDGDEMGTIGDQRAVGHNADQPIHERRMEAPSGFEPEMEVLQTSALPLGDGAVRLCRGIVPPAGRAREESEWSGKRDSNPRLRPWQGRTLPLSYSRPRRFVSVPQRIAGSQWADLRGRSVQLRGTYAVNACGYTSMRRRPSLKSTVTTSKRHG